MADLRELLRRFWGIHSADVRPLEGGMNSETWVVRHPGSAFVAKRVRPADIAGLVAGCEIAWALADAGLVTGRPVPTTDGRLVLIEHTLALLEHVPGRGLEGKTDEEQAWIARTLAGVHAAGIPAPSNATFAAHWLEAERPGIEPHGWLNTATAAVRAETDPLILTWSVLHADPSPNAFIHNDSTGVTGLIDWAGAQRGPVLYDVASAVMYLGGPDRAAVFLATYQTHGCLDADEMRWLDSFRRFRWVVQGHYFARRLALDDLTGIADRADNEKGLVDARRGLSGLGLDTE